MDGGEFSMRSIKKLAAKTSQKYKIKFGKKFNRFFILSFYLIAFGSTGAMIYLATNDGIFSRGKTSLVNIVMAKTVQMGFTVNKVFVANRKMLSKDKLLNALQLKLGQPILFYDMTAAKKRVERLGWVKHVSINRQLPDKIYIVIKERKPIAVWQHDNIFTLIDNDGELIGNQISGYHPNLKIIIGKNAPKNAAILINMLSKEPAINKVVTTAIYIGNRRWNLHLENGININLPEKKPLEAWHRLAKIEKQHGLFKKDVNVIDMRQQDKLIIGISNNGAEKLFSIKKNILENLSKNKKLKIRPKTRPETQI